MAKTPIINQTGLIFRETFRNTSDVIDNGGVVYAGTISNGSYTPTGATAGGISYHKPDLSYIRDEFTVAVKVNVPNGDGSATPRLIHYYADSSFEFTIAWQQSNDRMYFNINTDSSGTGFLGGVGSADSFDPYYGTDTWVIMTYDGTTLKWYHDDTLINQDGVKGATGLSADNTEPYFLNIARHTVSANDDPMSEVRIYDRALTLAEITDIVNETTFGEIDDAQALMALPLRSYYNDGANDVTENVGSMGGTLSLGGATPPVQLVPKGMEFDGSTSQLNYSSPVVPATGEFTVAAMVNVYDLTSTNGVYGQYYDEVSQRFLVGANSTNVFGQIGGTALSSPHNDLILNKPAQIVYLRDSSNNVYLYVNGEEVNSGSNSTNVDQQAGTVGYYSQGTTATLNGALYTFRIFDFALTPTQIKFLYQKDRRLLNI